MQLAMANHSIQMFLQHYRVIRQAQVNTIRAYFQDLVDFAKFTGHNFPRQVERMDIRAFLVYLQAKGLKAVTIRRKVACLKSFYKHLVILKWLPANPFNGIIGPKKDHPLPKFLSQDEVHRLMKLPDTRTHAGKRNLAILETIYTAGLRISELAGIRTQDIDLGQRTMKVIGKRVKERILPLGRPAAQSIMAYLAAAPVPPGGYIFRNLRGQPLTCRSIERVISGYMVQIGRPELSAHSLRHSFATHMLENGCNIRYIQVFLGHENVSTTQRYTHVNLAALKKNGGRVLEAIREGMNQMQLFTYNQEWEASCLISARS